MEIQYLNSVDVEWQVPVEGGESSLASHGEKDADSACAKGGKAVDSAETQELLLASQNLSFLHSNPPRPSATTAGSIARKEKRLLRFALRTSALYGKGFDASLPSAGLPESSLVSAEHDFYDICKWDYRPGHFPLTPEGLQQMKFDHYVDPRPPKYVFPASVLLFISTNRNEEEEACFQSLSREWDHWFDEALSYDILKKGSPKRMGLTSEESNWCQVTLEFLVKQIKSEIQNQIERVSDFHNFQSVPTTQVRLL
jgi:hypothetical protein